jgi:hypothetical protein
MLPGKRDGAGRLYVSSADVPAGSPFMGGMALSHTGQLYVSNTSVPAPVKALGLNFLDGKLDSRITFTRNSIGTYFDKNGVMQTAQPDVPRFSYHPITRQMLGLFIEQASTNLTKYSGAPSILPSGQWSPTGATLDAGYGIAPDGTQRTGLLTSDGLGGQSYCAINVPTATAGDKRLNSIFARKSTAKYIHLMYTSVNGWVTWNLDTGMVVSQGSGGGTFTNSPAPGELINGMWRFVLPITMNVNGAFRVYGLSAIPAVFNPTEPTVCSVEIWGAQTELGDYASSYIPTEGVAVTREADVASMTGTNFSSWYNSLEGTIEASAITRQRGASQRLVNISDSTNTNVIDISVFSSNQVRFAVTVGGTAQTNITKGLITNDEIFSAVGAYKLNDFAGASSIQPTVSVDTVGTVPVVDRMYLGSNASSGAFLNGYLRTVDYYNSRLPDSELVQLLYDAQFVNGFWVNDDGKLQTAPGGAIANYAMGLPFTVDGHLVVQFNQTPAASDPYVGGVRVGAAGVYVTDGVPVILDRPENTVPPEVTGIADVGQTLTCSTGTWTNNPTSYSYRWFQSNTPIIGANSNTYVVVEADRGDELVCVVTAINAAGGNSAASNGITIGSGRYNYTTSTNQFPAPGNITVASGSLIIRMNIVDKDGKNFRDVVGQLKAGDSIFIGITEGVFVNDPYVNSSDIALFSVSSWVPPANGEYLVTVETATS